MEVSEPRVTLIDAFTTFTISNSGTLMPIPINLGSRSQDVDGSCSKVAYQKRCTKRLCRAFAYPHPIPTSTPLHKRGAIF